MIDSDLNPRTLLENLPDVPQDIDYLIIALCLEQHNSRVEFRVGDDYLPGGEWIWLQSFDAGDLIIHGDLPGYTRREAYEDALRNLLNMTPLADERKL